MASLRAMMGRAARRVLSEKVLVFLCGPSPNPARASATGSASQAAVAASATGSASQAAVAASASQEAAAAQPSDALRGRVSTSRYPRRPTRMRKKAVSRLIGITLLTLAFLEGYQMAKDDDQKIQ